MSEHIYYSILQYKHSIVVGETLNVGILFSFPKYNKIKFVSGNLQRIKSLYSDFDFNLPQKINKSIGNKIFKLDSDLDNLFTKKVVFSIDTEDSLADYIKKYILLEDSTSLQFSDPFTAVDIFDNSEKTIEEYSRLLLPDITNKKETNKHNESYILKKFSDNLLKRNIIIDHRFTRNKVIETTGVHLNFDYAWKNGTTHLIKPISFDLKEERDIQIKSIQYFGYLDLLEEYAKRNEFKFDLLLCKPQDEKLFKSYENAIEIINKSKAPKEIFTEERLTEYTNYTADELHKKDLLITS